MIWNACDCYESSNGIIIKDENNYMKCIGEDCLVLGVYRIYNFLGFIFLGFRMVEWEMITGHFS